MIWVQLCAIPSYAVVYPVYGNKTAPNKDDVMRYFRTEYQSSEFRCSQVFLSISRHLSDVILSLLKL